MTRLTRTALFALGVVAFAVAPAVADHHELPSAEDVIAAHIAAKGGADAWAAIDSLKLTGDFTAFSRISPFAAYKTRNREYHMAQKWGDHPVTIGFDGAEAWWDNHMMRKGAQPVRGVDRAVLERDLDFATPFFDVEAQGHEVTVVGFQDLDGQQVLAVELKRADESTETWFLDPETYLEVARDSPGSDFGRPMTQRTFFDDFREVAGALIPHYTETQWYTRHRVIAADSIEANVEIPEGLFSMPPPYGMEKLQSLAGTWKVTVESRQAPSAPWQNEERVSEIQGRLRGGLFEETYATPTAKVIRSLSYDQYRDRYLLTQIHSGSNVLDILAGTWTEDGALLLDNVVTETPALMFGRVLHERFKLFEIGADAFKVERENSVDGGENWALMQKLTFERQAGENSEEAGGSR